MSVLIVVYIRNRLKSGSALEYFEWDNDIFTPIEVITTDGDLTNIEDVSEFEETKNRFTSQFSCKFKYSEIGSRETKVATGAHVDLEELTDNTNDDFDIKFEN